MRNEAVALKVKALYEGGNSQSEVARQLGIHQSAVFVCLKRLGVQARSDSDALKLAWRKDPRYKRLEAEKLRYLYIDRRIPSREIAEALGTSASTVSRRLREMGIRLTRSEAQKKKRWRKTPKARSNFQGYIQLYQPYHPRANKKGRVFEHIIVWEQANGIPVPEGYVIHHLNGEKGDNRLKNLVALPRKEHSPILLLKAVQRQLRILEAELAQQKLAF